MLNVSVQSLGNVTVFRCQGRIMSGDEDAILRKAVLSQTDTKVVVLDLEQVSGIDAGGLGVLLGLRAWTRSNGIRLKLMNVLGSIRQMLEVTNLDRVFEICSEEELVDPMNPADDMALSSRARLDQLKTPSVFIPNGGHEEN
jgi:anti-anti-sigma factor